MHQTQSQPTATTHTTMNRRQALTETLSLGLGALGLASFAFAVERGRTHVTRLSSGQEEFLKAALKENLQWNDRSHEGKEVYQARTSEGAGLVIARARIGHSTVIWVTTSDVECPFKFRCPMHSIDVREKGLLLALFDQARMPPAIPRERPHTLDTHSSSTR